MNKHKDIIIACKLEFDDHLWPPFVDKPQSYVVVF